MKHRYVSIESLARSAAKRWRLQYFDMATCKWIPLADGKDSSKIYLHLLYHDKGITPREVAEIIGNTTWTDLTCDACEQEIQEGYMVGADESFESHCCTLCFDCIAKLHLQMQQRLIR